MSEFWKGRFVGLLDTLPNGTVSTQVAVQFLINGLVLVIEYLMEEKKG